MDYENKELEQVHDWVLYESFETTNYKNLVYRKTDTWVLIEQFKEESQQQTTSGFVGTYITEDYYVTVFYEVPEHDSTQSEIKQLLDTVAKRSGWKCKSVNEEVLGGAKDVYEYIGQYDATR